MGVTTPVKTRRRKRRQPSPSAGKCTQQDDEKSRRELNELVSVVGAGGDGSKAKTRIKRGNTSKLVNLLQDKIHFTPYEDYTAKQVFTECWPESDKTGSEPKVAEKQEFHEEPKIRTEKSPSRH